jgi:hypothetical protein
MVPNPTLDDWIGLNSSKDNRQRPPGVEQKQCVFFRRTLKRMARSWTKFDPLFAIVYADRLGALGRESARSLISGMAATLRHADVIGHPLRRRPTTPTPKLGIAERKDR